jgi:hypothetical protein
MQEEESFMSNSLISVSYAMQLIQTNHPPTGRICLRCFLTYHRITPACFVIEIERVAKLPQVQQTGRFEKSLEECSSSQDIYEINISRVRETLNGWAGENLQPGNLNE